MYFLHRFEQNRSLFRLNRLSEVGEEDDSIKSRSRILALNVCLKKRVAQKNLNVKNNSFPVCRIDRMGSHQPKS